MRQLRELLHFLKSEGTPVPRILWKRIGCLWLKQTRMGSEQKTASSSRSDKQMGHTPQKLIVERTIQSPFTPSTSSLHIPALLREQEPRFALLRGMQAGVCKASGSHELSQGLAV